MNGYICPVCCDTASFDEQEWRGVAEGLVACDCCGQGDYVEVNDLLAFTEGWDDGHSEAKPKHPENNDYWAGWQAGAKVREEEE